MFDITDYFLLRVQTVTSFSSSKQLVHVVPQHKIAQEYNDSSVWRRSKLTNGR